MIWCRAPFPLAGLRARAGLTQAELAQRAGLLPARLVELEDGAHAPLSLWQRLGALFGLKREDVMQLAIWRCLTGRGAT